MNTNNNNQQTSDSTTTSSSDINQNTLNILDPNTSEYPDFNWNNEQTNAWAARFLNMEDFQKFKEANFNGEALSSLQREDLEVFNRIVKITFGASLLLIQRISKGIATLSQSTATTTSIGM
ncbi:histidine kinase [Tieghemostelium lacteum]|uniref:Histidine kinase n=1 Tax=Tieghemostelium lacteum TaxID=361077 RepID=A0A152A8Y6_TIELA|nr:histidine kinase [Tieghemostelium lacteum]|eukprot:KYR02679.1 histidine kinase [Tieghemostelium lacteum]